MALPSLKKTFWLTVILVTAVACAYIGYRWYNATLEIKEAKFVSYPAFGIDIPASYSIHGIDVSSHQDYIYWKGVKSMKVKDIEMRFAFIKATEGIESIDKLFARNWREAKKLGMAKGAYHFFIATKSGKIQATNFINNVKIEAGDLPPVVDVEELYGVKPADMRKRLKECLQTIEEHYKVKPILYSYVSFYDNYLGKEFDDYPLWVAHYFEKEKPRINRPWIFWQYSEQGRINGITSKVDFNVFNGDTTAFKKLLVK
jgi:lysozyme